MRLTAKGVKGLTKAGKYYDGDGLFLHALPPTGGSGVSVTSTAVNRA